MNLQTKIKHTANTVQLMRKHLFLQITHHIGEGVFFIRFGKEGNMDWWGMYRDGNYYSFHRINDDISFKVAYRCPDKGLIKEPIQVMRIIKEYFEKNIHYKFD